MRAIGVLKLLLLIGPLLIGSIADAGAARAKEEIAPNRIAAEPAVESAARVAVRAFHPQRLQLLPVHPDLRLASLSTDEMLRADLFSTDRSRALASSVFAGDFARNSASTVSGATAEEQQRALVLLQKRLIDSRMRSSSDFWLMTLIGVMLVAYQLCRKHRFLRPQPFAL